MRVLAIIGYVLFLAVFACKDPAPRSGQSTLSVESADTSALKGFDAMSSDYYEMETRVIWQKPALVLNLLGDLEGKTVADIGAGTGYFAFRIATQGGNVIAIDIDERAISWMETEKERYPEEVRSRFQTRLGTPSDPKLTPQEVDVVLMVNTYMYISNREAYLRNLTSALKPGAQVIIIDFKKKETPIGPDTAARLAATQVQQELSRMGYAILSSDDTALEYQYIITAARPQ